MGTRHLYWILTGPSFAVYLTARRCSCIFVSIPPIPGTSDAHPAARPAAGVATAASTYSFAAACRQWRIGDLLYNPNQALLGLHSGQPSDTGIYFCFKKSRRNPPN
jgi:hypothetical protein